MYDRLLWLDLETTGRDPERHHIIEVAAILTDGELRELTRYHSVVYQTKYNLEAAEPEALEMHAKSDLLRECQVASWPRLYEVDADMARVLPDGTILAGSSIHFDRSFIRHQMPQLEAKLHYRMLDVTSVSIALNMPMPEGEKAHRAVADIEKSLGHMRSIRECWRRGTAFTAAAFHRWKK